MSIDRMSWKWEGHQEVEAKEGTATYYFAGGELSLPLPSFKTAFDLAQAINAERDAAVDRERQRLARALHNHIDTITR